MIYKTLHRNQWQSLLLVNGTGVPGENQRPVASHWQTLSQFTEMMRENRMNMIQTVVSFVSWMNNYSGEMLLENS
jgi:hypothetical protein